MDNKIFETFQAFCQYGTRAGDVPTHKAFAFLAVHAVVIDLMTHRDDNLLERGLDRRVFRRLTVFVDQRNPHK